MHDKVITIITEGQNKQAIIYTSGWKYQSDDGALFLLLSLPLKNDF